ncbi:MAG: hypothetical protein AAF543_24365 [Pseudomonadota bacterium]
MREPTPASEIYRWHAGALGCERAPKFEGHVEAGWFKLRLVKGGPWIPVHIWLEQITDGEGRLAAPEEYRCTVNGKTRNPHRVFFDKNLIPIAVAEFDRMAAHIEWCGSNRPLDPVMFPDSPVPISKSPTLPGA